MEGRPRGTTNHIRGISDIIDFLAIAKPSAGDFVDVVERGHHSVVFHPADRREVAGAGDGLRLTIRKLDHRREGAGSVSVGGGAAIGVDPNVVG